MLAENFLLIQQFLYITNSEKKKEIVRRPVHKIIIFIFYSVNNSMRNFKVKKKTESNLYKR